MTLLRDYSSLFARLALGAGLLSAVADRWGGWGAPGQPNVAWGDWAHFVAYTAQVNSFVPPGLAPLLAALATAAELGLGLCLVLGLCSRVAAFATAGLLGLFALAMALSFGIKAPLDYSVGSAAACALLLAAAPAHPLSLDAWRATRPPRPGGGR